MDLSVVLGQLRRELEHINAAIASLERLQEKAVARGRPRKLPYPPTQTEAGERRKIRRAEPQE